MKVTLNDFKQEFKTHVTIKNQKQEVHCAWQFGPFTNRPVIETSAYCLYKLLINFDEAFSCHNIIHAKSKFEFVLKIANKEEDKTFVSIAKPHFSKEQSDKFRHYFYFVAFRLYRDFGITSPLKLPKDFIRIYSGESTVSKLRITNPTDSEKSINKREIEQITLQFDQRLVEQIKMPSLIIRK